MKDNNESKSTWDKEYEVLDRQLITIEKCHWMLWGYMLLQIIFTITMAIAYIPRFIPIGRLPYAELVAMFVWIFSTILLIIILVTKRKIEEPYSLRFNKAPIWLIIIGHVTISIIGLIGCGLLSRDFATIGNQIDDEVSNLSKKYKKKKTQPKIETTISNEDDQSDVEK